MSESTEHFVARRATDAEVIAVSVERPEVFEEIFGRHYHVIYRYASRRVGPDAAGDLATEVFERAFAARVRYDPAKTSARSWLFGIAAHLVRQRHRLIGDEPWEASAEEVAAAVHTAFDALAGEYARHGRSLAELGTSQEIATRLVAVLPRPSPWNDVIGPFYTSRQVALVLGGISRQALADRRGRRTLLALRTEDGEWVYPVRQFDASGRVLEGLPGILRLFEPDVVDEWTVAGWLAAPMTPLEGMSPIEWLREGRDPRLVVALAEAAAARWAA